MKKLTCLKLSPRLQFSTIEQNDQNVATDRITSKRDLRQEILRAIKCRWNGQYGNDRILVNPADKMTSNRQQSLNQSFFRKTRKASLSLPPIQQHKQPLRRYYMDNLMKSFKSQSKSLLFQQYREHFKLVAQGLRIINQSIISPLHNKILLPKVINKQKTVILDLDETLIHYSEHLSHCNVRINIQRENGKTMLAGINIRPYCREFLKSLSQIAEIIIFTSSQNLYADSIINYLDPQGKLISHRLYREHCTLWKQHFLKDLRNINRSLEHTVLVDNTSISYALQPENGIPIIPFYQNSKDKQLSGLIVYLRDLLKQADVRPMNREHFKIDKWKQADPKSALLRD